MDDVRPASELGGVSSTCRSASFCLEQLWMQHLLFMKVLMHRGGAADRLSPLAGRYTAMADLQPAWADGEAVNMMMCLQRINRRCCSCITRILISSTVNFPRCFAASRLNEVIKTTANKTKVRKQETRRVASWWALVLVLVRRSNRSYCWWNTSIQPPICRSL